MIVPASWHGIVVVIVVHGLLVSIVWDEIHRKCIPVLQSHAFEDAVGNSVRAAKLKTFQMCVRFFLWKGGGIKIAFSRVSLDGVITFINIFVSETR